LKGPSARRISIVGATGSGKSFLARRLAKDWGLPLYELDRMYWSSAGQEVSNAQFIEAVSDLIGRDEWLLDGHYRAVRQIIWDRADMIVWLNYPLWLVGRRLLQRYLQKGRAGESGVAEQRNADDRQDRGLPRASWRGRLGRLRRTLAERREYARLLRAPEYRHVEIVELRSVRATEEWLRERAPHRA
jgi:adenylate kinase family enzyme